jgi:hypothetical protein
MSYQPPQVVATPYQPPSSYGASYNNGGYGGDAAAYGGTSGEGQSTPFVSTTPMANVGITANTGRIYIAATALFTISYIVSCATPYWIDIGGWTQLHQGNILHNSSHPSIHISSTNDLLLR